MLGSLSGRRVNAMAQREAVQAAEVRHMSYEESDNIEIAVVEGYTLKGKLEGQQVYVEAKYEDGRTEAYHVDTAKVQEQTQHKIEQFALETAAPSQKNGMAGTAARAFVEKMKQADEARESGEFLGSTESIDIILRQMEEPEKWAVTKMIFHNGVGVSVTKDPVEGVIISIGGSKNPEIVSVKTSVGTVKVDLNDVESVMKCLDLFSPEDVSAIMREITKGNQLRNAKYEMEEAEDELIRQTKDTGREEQ